MSFGCPSSVILRSLSHSQVIVPLGSGSGVTMVYQLFVQRPFQIIWEPFILAQGMLKICSGLESVSPSLKLRFQNIAYSTFGPGLA